MAAADDRLSALSDDLLRHILYFLPFKEAASTSVLSRRYGSLWRSSGAVNLAVRVPEYNSNEEEAAFFSRRDAFVHAADAALTATVGRCHVRRLTFLVEADSADVIDAFLHQATRRRRTGYVHHAVTWLERQEETRRDVVGDVVSHRAARRVEELRVGAVGAHVPAFVSDVDSSREEIFYLDLAALPSRTLRVLELTGCSGLTPLDPAAAFPRLATLRLRLCSVRPAILQAVIDAAPRLATVHLESVFFETEYYSGGAGTDEGNKERVRLRFPATTTLVLEFCGMTEVPCPGHVRGAIAVDAPMLRSFTYRGTPRRFSLTSPALDMARVHLHVHDKYSFGKETTRELFWHFIRNVHTAKSLNLKVDCHLKHIAVAGADAELLQCTFPNIDHLVLEGEHKRGSNGAAVAIANLLRCCPAVHDLTLKLTTSTSETTQNHLDGRDFLRRKYKADFDKSIDQFMRRRSNKTTMMVSSHDEDDEVISEIPGLSGRTFPCLQSSLRRVALQFRLDNANCFGVRLIKFFTENAMVLEELCIDSGNRKLHEHMNLGVERWIVAGSSSENRLKRKNDEEGSWEFCKVPRRCLDSTPHLGMGTRSSWVYGHAAQKVKEYGVRYEFVYIDGCVQCNKEENGFVMPYNM